MSDDKAREAVEAARRGPFSAEEKFREIEREVAMRKRVYPEQQRRGRLSAANAERQIAIMEAVLEDYRRAARRERGGELFPEFRGDEYDSGMGWLP